MYHLLYLLQTDELAKKRRPYDPLTNKWSSASTTGWGLTCIHALVWHSDMVWTHLLFMWHILPAVIQSVMFWTVCIPTKSQHVFVQCVRHKPICYIMCVTDRKPKCTSVMTLFNSVHDSTLRKEIALLAFNLCFQTKTCTTLERKKNMNLLNGVLKVNVWLGITYLFTNSVKGILSMWVRYMSRFFLLIVFEPILFTLCPKRMFRFCQVHGYLLDQVT